MTDWDQAIADARAKAQGGGSSSSSTDDPPVYLGKNSPTYGQTQKVKVKGTNAKGRVNMPDETSTVHNDTAPMSQAMGLMHTWYGTAKYNDWAEKLDALNLLTPDQEGDFTTIDGWWQKAVQAASDFQASGRGKIDPWQALEILAGTKAAQDKRKIDSGHPQPTVESQTSITSPDAARDLVTKALQARLGRNPNEDELRTLTGLLNAKEQANPTITRTTYGADGRSSAVTTTGGVDAAATVDQGATNLPGYAEWQAAGTYGPALMAALRTPVGN